MLRFILALSLALSLSAPLLAVQPGEIMADPAKEARARALSRDLRCMVCQNQSIDDSDAPLARDLRLLVRERIAAGDSDREVIDFLVGRYGEFVLLSPRLSLSTILLWTGPFIVLLLGIIMARSQFRRRTDAVAPLSEEEQAALARLTSDHSKTHMTKN